VFGNGHNPPKPWKKVKEEASLPKIDAKDFKILSALFNNSREKTYEIAKKVGLTPEGVNYRMKRLAKEGILNGYTSWFDARKLGFGYYKLLIWLSGATRTQEKAFFDFCLQKDEVVYLNKIMGSWDIEVDAIFKNNEEMHAFVREIKTKHGDFIGRHEILSVVAEKTLNPLREY
jgi:DNA-binding Lrp family transcriptional regulator